MELAFGKRAGSVGPIRLEGLVLGDHVQRASVSRVDFVDCDMTGISFATSRLSGDVIVEDCTFTDCTWGPDYPSAVRHATFRSCAFERCALDAAGGTNAVFEDCTLIASQISDGSLEECVLRRVVMRDVKLQKVHWHRCTFEDVEITGEARTLVISDARYRSFDVSGLRMMDCDLGLTLEAHDVRLPASPELFVISEASFHLAAERLASQLSPRAFESYRAMAQAVYGPMVVVERSLFTPAPDLPGMATTPAEIDAIMSELWQHHIKRLD
jgi:hypothetical protein